jgi:hypothetical protein
MVADSQFYALASHSPQSTQFASTNRLYEQLLFNSSITFKLVTVIINWMLVFTWYLFKLTKMWHWCKTLVQRCPVTLQRVQPIIYLALIMSPKKMANGHFEQFHVIWNLEGEKDELMLLVPAVSCSFSLLTLFQKLINRCNQKLFLLDLDILFYRIYTSKANTLSPGVPKWPVTSSAY